MANARHARLNRYFDTYDTDRNDAINGADFDLQAKRRIEALHLDTGSPSAAAVRQVYTDFWQGLGTRCDLDGNGSVSRAEWIKVWDDAAHTAETFEDLPPWFRSMFDNLCRALFRGGAEMTLADLEAFLNAVGRGDLKAAAQRALLANKEKLTRPELEALWFQYLCSDEPTVPDVLFG